MTNEMTMEGIITEDSKPNKYQKLTTEILKGLLNKRNRQLAKIKQKISFESNYENYNQDNWAYNYERQTSTNEVISEIIEVVNDSVYRYEVYYNYYQLSCDTTDPECIDGEEWSSSSIFSTSGYYAPASVETNLMSILNLDIDVDYEPTVIETTFLETEYTMDVFTTEKDFFLLKI